jgi:hypothetical protein
MKEVGLDENSPFQDVFASLFNLLHDGIYDARYFVENHRWNKGGESFEEFILRLFSEKTLQKILAEEGKGYRVYMGDWYSDNGEIEGFFCTSSFIIDTPNLFVDASNDAW